MQHISFLESEKQLFLEEQEVVSYFLDRFAKKGIETVESALGIEFAFEDGTFRSDGAPEGQDENKWESQDVDETVFRLECNSSSGAPGMPESFPALLVTYEFHGDGGSHFFSSTWAYPEDFDHDDRD